MRYRQDGSFRSEATTDSGDSGGLEGVFALWVTRIEDLNRAIAEHHAAAAGGAETVTGTVRDLGAAGLDESVSS